MKRLILLAAMIATPAFAAPATVLYTAVKGNNMINLTDGDCYDTKGGYHPVLMAAFAVNAKSQKITMGCWQLGTDGRFVVVLNNGVIYRLTGNELTGL